MNSNFTDERGTIRDLFVTDEFSVTEITFNAGAVRGNHYHEHTKQIDIVMEGELLLRSCRIVWSGSDEIITPESAPVVLMPHTAHAYKANAPTRMISICFGTRIGDSYEKDVVRLKEPLI